MRLANLDRVAVNANIAKAVIEKAGIGKVDLVDIDENAMWPAISKGDTLDGCPRSAVRSRQGLRDLHHRQEGHHRRRPAGPGRQDRLVRAAVRGRQHPGAGDEGFKDPKLAALFKTAESGDEVSS